jgi:hypothetical protein
MKRVHILFSAIVLCLTSSIGNAAEARLILKARISLSGGAVYSEDNVNFYGTHVYLLESAMLRHRAEDALGHSAPADLKITAERVPNASIILVTASAAEDAAATSFVSALVDEFLKFKREQKRRVYVEEIARIDTALKSASREVAPDFQKLKQQLITASVLDPDGEFERLPDK